MKDKKHTQTTCSRRAVAKAVAGAGVGMTLSSGTATGQTDSREEWYFGTNGSIDTSPTIIGDTAYITAASVLYAVSVSDGTEKWSTSISDSASWTSPAVIDGTVYTGTNSAAVHAVDAATGEMEWTYTNMPDFHRVRASPTVKDGTVYIGSGWVEPRDGTIHAIDATDGTAQWTVDLDRQVFSSAITVGDELFIGSNDNLYALDPTDGSELWQYGTDQSFGYSSPTVVDDVLYIGGYDQHLKAVDISDGTELWTFETGRTIHSSPTVLDDTVYFGSGDGNVYAVDTAGNEVWTFEAGEYVWSSPTIVGERVFVGSINEGKIYSIHAGDGTAAWEFEPGDGVWSSPVVVDGILYVGSDDGNLYALDTDVEGSSDGSRVNQGTLGHHHTWAGGKTSDEDDRGDESPTVADYADADGVVRADGLQNGFNDWAAGEISGAVLQSVFNAWQSGEPVDTTTTGS